MVTAVRPCRTTGSNPDHKWNVSYEKVVAAMEKVGIGWNLIDFQTRNQDDEYSLFFVFRIKVGGVHDFSWTLPKPEKTCGIIRYGAIGDMIMVSSLFPWLKAEGYDLTVYCQEGDGYESVKHDPHVDRPVQRFR
mgnify:FL=1